MMKRIFFFVILLISIVACKGGEKVSKITESKFSFGTYISITVYDKDEAKAKKAIQAGFNEIERIDSKYNSKVQDSGISKLNSHKIKELILDKEGVYLINNLRKLYEISHGTYDVTIAPLLEIWNFENIVQETLPKDEELKKAMENIDFTKVKLENNILSYEKDGIEIDTGSFLKGYAVARAKQVMVDMGIKSAFISSVSSIETINTKPGNKLWKIGIENPENSQKVLGIIELNNQAMGVSGDYQTYIEINGKKYHHILDKRTGYPVRDKKMVVVVSDSAFLSDMYSTAFFTMPIDEIIQVCKENNLEVLIVDSEMKLHQTSGLKFKKK